jgi:hypothetical protein
MQSIFVIYNCISSVFFYFDLQGFLFFDKVADEASFEQFVFAARAQNYSVLAHAAFVQGMIFSIPKYAQQQLDFKAKVNIDVLIKIIIGSFFVATILRQLGTFSSISATFGAISTTTTAFCVVYAINERRRLFLTTILFVVNFYFALNSGMKEEIAMFIIILLINLFPKFPVTTIILTLIFGNLMLYIPTYTHNLRLMNWFGDGTNKTLDVVEIMEITYEQVNTTDENQKEKNRKDDWAFLAYRFSEFDSFVKYMKYVPGARDYYGMEIIQNGLLAIIPAGLRPDGKSLDETAQQKTIDAGVLHRFIAEGGTSAKPSIVADLYLMGDALAIAIFMFIYGSVATYTSLIAEKLFGGYESGTLIVSTCCFYILMKGNCTENMFASLFQGCLAMIVCYYLMRYFRLFD